jgi:hypothetical protein
MHHPRSEVIKSGKEANAGGVATEAMQALN